MENFNINCIETEVLEVKQQQQQQPKQKQQQLLVVNDCYKRIKKIETTTNDSTNKFPDDEEKHIIGHHILNNDVNVLKLKNSSQENNLSSKDEINEKYRVLLSYEDAPKHLKFNPFIRSGYRTFLPTKLCIQSIFWWTNETINIWSHILGWLLFVCMTFNDIRLMTMYDAFTDKIIILSLLFCFQMCMLLSSIYHIFSCRSEKDYDSFLTFDLFGIALSLFAIYMSGIYYAFWCHENLRNFYSITVAAIFISAMIIQIPSLNVTSNAKVCVFVGWAVYGFIPTLHWTISMGGFQHPMVKLFIPRVITMYAIVGIAFLFYIAKIPERWLTGKVDYFGHSHNWWHLFVLCALYYWHNTGLVYADFRMNYGCYMLPKQQ